MLLCDDEGPCEAPLMMLCEIVAPPPRAMLPHFTLATRRRFCEDAAFVQRSL